MSAPPALKDQEILKSHRLKSHRPEDDPRSLRYIPMQVVAGTSEYLPDVYEKSRQVCNDPWTIDSSSRPYLSHIKSLIPGWPHLKYLADFMEVTTVPTKWRFLEASDRAMRASKTNIAVLDFSPDNDTETYEVTSLKELQEALHTPLPVSSTTRLFIVEDLSSNVIEALGSAFDIDPQFFRAHICDYMWYNLRDPWIELKDLKMVANERNFINVRYMHAVYFDSLAAANSASKEAKQFNVLRRLDSDNNFKNELDAKGSSVEMVRCKTGLWWREGTEEEGGIGILLVDPSIPSGSALWGGPKTISNCPSMSSTISPSSAPRLTTFQDAIYWAQRLSAHEIRFLYTEQRILFKPMLKTACAEWYIVIQYITTRLVQIEWELENPQFRNDPRGLDASLQKLHPWRRSLPRFQEMVSEALESLSSSSGNDEEDNLWDLRHEFQRISAQLLLLQNRTEAIVNVAAAIINIEESKRAIEQNRNFARLTYLGLVFVPMSFVSSFYSMSNDISSLKDSFWIYFVTALPITVLALLVARYFMVLRDWIAKLGWDIGGVASSAERVASK